MVVLTKIYEETPQTIQMVESFERFGYEVGVIRSPHLGNGETLRELYETYKRAITGHETFVYSDGADTYCQLPFTVPNDKLIWSTEKAIYPQDGTVKYPPNKSGSQWCYLNGGGVMGSLALMIEFMEKYGLTNLPNEASGQLEITKAYLKARKDKFPIELDFQCKYFQTIAFIEENEFGVYEHLGREENEPEYIVMNKVTGQKPAIFHANGLTPTPRNWPFLLW
jgi:hypothetical protein